MSPDLPAWQTETAAALLQSAILAALAGLCLLLYLRHRKTYLAWWAVGWAIYALRLGAIIVFLRTGDRVWLYWHQVVTGWSALALLWAALVFARQTPWRPAYLAFVLFPPLWSFVAIYRLEHFLLAAVPSVVFLSAVTAGTGWAFWVHRRRVGGTGAGLLAGTLLLWGLHHLDYPFLRAQGAWNPWGYYLDILFALGTGTGLLLLVMDDQRRGLAALSALAADLQRDEGEGGTDVLDLLLGRALHLPAVRGTALYSVTDDAPRFVRGAGACAAWGDAPLSGRASEAVRQAARQGRPQTANHWEDPRGSAAPFAFGAVLPVLGDDGAMGGLVIVGDARDPFTALDESFLTALGRQVGAALERSALSRRLQARNAELASLSARMVRQHEDERRRLSRELHDETAQVLSAVKMQLGILHQEAPAELGRELARVAELVDEGIESIRSVTHDLRPSLLDDLGLVPALRALAQDFRDRSGLAVHLTAAEAIPRLPEQAELALYRTLQEALSNVAQHAGARSVSIALDRGEAGDVRLRISDDGRGFDLEALARLEREGHLGLAGMRERLEALGGAVAITTRPGAGVALEVRMPTEEVPA